MARSRSATYDARAMAATATLASKAVTVTPGGEAVSEVRVRNSGTVVDQFTLEVLGDASAWAIVEPAVVPLFPGAEAVARIKFKPPKSSSVPARAIPAEAGTVGFATIRVSPRQRFLTGPPKISPYKVLVHQDGLPTLTVDGSMQQEGLIPRWLVPALIGLVALLLIAVILWFALLKPSISSAAKDAVAPQALAVQSLASRLPAANPGAQSGGGADATGANPVQGKVWSSRLAINPDVRPLESTVTVPDGGGLAVTDLVFENPNGNSGTLYLVRREANKPDQVLMTLRLENFRDLDFHFVTPLVFKKKQTMALSCGPDPAGSRCDASAYYSGYFKNPPSS